MSNRIKRRQFLKDVSAAGLTLAAGPAILSCEEQTKTDTSTDDKEVAAVEKTDAVVAEEAGPDPLIEARANAEQSGKDIADSVKKKALERPFPMHYPGRVLEVKKAGVMVEKNKIDDEAARKLLYEGLKRFTGMSTAAAALGLFIKPDELVGLKINTLGKPNSSFNPVSAFALVDALVELGVKKQNIVIFDLYGSHMRKSGYRIKDEQDDVHVIANKQWKWDKKETEHGAGKSTFCNVIKKVDAVINCCVTKDHALSGVTGAIKNMAFGCIKEPDKFHKKPGKYCSPAIAHIYNHEYIKPKVRLIVNDSLQVLYQGGPQDNDEYKAIHDAYLFSTDPVTMDVAILDLVNHYRAAHKKKLAPIDEDTRKDRKTHFLQVSADLGLGIADREKINWEKVTLT